MECKRAASVISQVMEHVPHSRRWDLLSWLSEGFDSDGWPVARTPENQDLINHMDCPLFDECRADVASGECQRAGQT